MDKDYMNILRKSMDDCINGAYEEGLNDAWKCARKITARTEQGGLANPELLTMFDFRICADILVRYTPQEAIAKIKQYEEKQKQTDNCPKKKPNELSSDCDRFEPKPCAHDWENLHSWLTVGHERHADILYCTKCGLLRIEV